MIAEAGAAAKLHVHVHVHVVAVHAICKAFTAREGAMKEASCSSWAMNNRYCVATKPVRDLREKRARTWPRGAQVVSQTRPTADLCVLLGYIWLNFASVRRCKHGGSRGRECVYAVCGRPAWPTADWSQAQLYMHTCTPQSRLLYSAPPYTSDRA